MPRDAFGNYSLPPIYQAVTGQTIIAEQHNAPFEDVASAVTGSLARNGSGGMTAALNMQNNRVVNVAAATAPTDVVNRSQLTASVPIGVIFDYAGATAPTGWLLCAGQLLNRADYPDLFAVVGIQYNLGGEPSTLFRLPDYRGRVSAGLDNMGGTDASRMVSQRPASINRGWGSGTDTHALTEAQNGPHAHSGVTALDGDHHHTLPSLLSGSGGPFTTPPIGSGIARSSSQITGNAGAHQHSFTTSVSGIGAAHNNVQPTIYMVKIIKALHS